MKCSLASLSFVTLNKQIFKSLGCLILGLTFFIPNSDAQKKFGAEDLKLALSELRQTILDTHQNPFTYCTEQEFDAAYDSTSEAIADSMDRMSFAREVGRFLSVLKDSHCYLNYSVLLGEHRKYGGHFVAFKVRLIDSSLYAYSDKEGLIPEGTQIISINGMDALDLFKQVGDYAMYEGDSFTGHTRITEAIYPQIVAVLAKIEDKNTFIVQGHSSEVPDTLIYPGRDVKYLKKNSEKKLTSEIQSLTLDSDLKLGVLKIGSFNWKTGRSYRRFLKRSFKTIKNEGIENLVVDIRDNTGGKADRAEMLYSYLSDQEINMPEFIIAKQSKVCIERNKKIYKGLTRFAINHFYKKNEEVQHYRTMMKMEEGEVDTFYYAQPEEPKTKYAFKGKTFLLMNGKSGSASVNFASGFKQLNIGTIVGEPCLGPESGTWGNPGSYSLTTSDLKVFLSTIRFGANGSFEVDPTAVQPDHHVPYNISDMVNDVDTQLEFVKGLLTLAP